MNPGATLRATPAVASPQQETRPSEYRAHAWAACARTSATHVAGCAPVLPESSDDAPVDPVGSVALVCDGSVALVCDVVLFCDGSVAHRPACGPWSPKRYPDAHSLSLDRAIAVDAGWGPPQVTLIAAFTGEVDGPHASDE